MRRRKAGARQVRRADAAVTGSEGSGLLRVLAILLPATVVVSIGLALMLVLDLQPGAGRQRAATQAPVAGENPQVALPEYLVAASPETQEAYRFALERPEALQNMPCYCGCGGSSGHKSLHDCFLKQVGDGIVEFDQHGSGCGICVNIALDVKEQLAQGKTLSQIRAYIDSEYSSIGPGTDTPLPPE